MKIGITCYPTYGGSGIVATELGLELARRGHEIHFITFAKSNPPRSRHPRHLLPRGRGFQVSVISVPAVQPSTRLSDGGCGQCLWIGPAPRSLRHSPLDFCIVGAADRRSTAPAGHHYVARNRYHVGQQRAILLLHNKVCDRPVRWRDSGKQLST